MPSLFLSRQQWTLFGVLMSTAAMMTYATGTALNGQLRPYADLSVTMRSPTSALPGMTISYAVKIQNAGPTNAVGALRSTMADYMAFQSAKGAKCVIVETELRCPFSLGPRKSMTVTLTFAAAEDAPCNTYSVHGVSVGSPNRADQNRTTIKRARARRSCVRWLQRSQRPLRRPSRLPNRTSAFPRKVPHPPPNSHRPRVWKKGHRVHRIYNTAAFKLLYLGWSGS